MAKNNFQYGGLNSYTLQCGTITTLISSGDCSKQASIFIRPINKQRYNIDEQRTRAGCQKSP